MYQLKIGNMLMDEMNSLPDAKVRAKFLSRHYDEIIVVWKGSDRVETIHPPK